MEVEIYANVCALIRNPDNTVSGWWISGVYDSAGNIRNTWKFPKAYKAEADLQPDNTVIIKFEP